MADVEQTITIKRPVDDVFAVIANPANDHRWSSAVIEAGITTPGPVGVGTTAHYVSRVLGRRLEYDWVITEFEVNRKLAARSVGTPLPTRAVFTFKPVTDGTRLTLAYWTEQRGALRIVWPLVTRIGNRQWQQAFRTLKELMEADAL